MKRLKKILQSSIFYLIFVILILIYILIFTKLIKYKSVYLNNNQNLTCTIISLKQKDTYFDLDLKCREKVKAIYYFKENEKFNINYGDTISFEGTIKNPNNNTIPNTFNYKDYLYNNKIYKIITLNKINHIKHSNNFLIILKNNIYKKCLNNKYLLLFIMGDKSLLETDIYENYQNIGVAHLLAISGMHIGMLILILKRLLMYIPIKIQNIIIIIILLYYAYIVNFSVSVVRVILFFIINLINKYGKFELNNIKILLLTSFLMLIYNPFLIYNLGFKYSFLAVLGVMLSTKYHSKNYLKNLVIITFFTSLLTLPITININYEINLILFISNLLLVPFVSFVLFPLSMLTLFFPFLSKIFIILQTLMEYIVNLLSDISMLNIIIPKLSFISIVIYYLVIYLFFKTDYKRTLLILILLLFINMNIGRINNNFLFTLFDVKQGDSISIIYPHNKKTILIDTGSSLYKNNLKNIQLYYKSIGINKINYFIISHGDYDHAGEAINLVNNFKVENVIFNCGPYNELEKDLIKVLDKKKIKYYSCVKELNIDKYKLEFLNTKEYDNENDNSNVIYFNYNDYKFLFMGDAGVEKENDILEKYNLKDIDFLKVGHHGSNTSSSKYFIDNINPKYSLISVGKNNRYGHPKDEVLDTLKNSKIYRTDLDGSIEIKLNKNGYKIRTCPP